MRHFTCFSLEPDGPATTLQPGDVIKADGALLVGIYRGDKPIGMKIGFSWVTGFVRMYDHHSFQYLALMIATNAGLGIEYKGHGCMCTLIARD